MGSSSSWPNCTAFSHPLDGRTRTLGDREERASVVKRNDIIMTEHRACKRNIGSFLYESDLHKI